MSFIFFQATAYSNLRYSWLVLPQDFFSLIFCVLDIWLIIYQRKLWDTRIRCAISLDVAGSFLVSHPVVIWVVRQPCPFFDPLAFLGTSRGLGSSCWINMLGNSVSATRWPFKRCWSEEFGSLKRNWRGLVLLPALLICLWQLSQDLYCDNLQNFWYHSGPGCSNVGQRYPPDKSLSSG